MDFKTLELKKLIQEPMFWLAVFFIVMLAVRLIIVFQTDNFNYDAYFTLRQVENIKSTGFPLYEDPLSYGGKTHLFAPFNYYLLAFFSILLPLEFVAKVLPNIFASLIIVLVYFIALRISKSTKISLISAFMAGFIPILFFDINGVSLDYLAMLLLFGIIYCIFRINDRKYTDYALILMFLLVLTSPLAFILILGLLLYILLARLENLKIEMKELEIILFFMFLVFWVNLLIYKKAFAQHGLLVVWQNIPVDILSNFFSQISFLETFYTISIIPLLLGLYAAYTVFYSQKSKEVLLLVGFAIAIFLLLWFRLLNLITALSFLSVTLVILSSFALKSISGFIEKSKVNRYENYIIAGIVIIFVLTATIPSVIIGLDRTRITPTEDDMKVLEWAGSNIPENSTIASSIEEGSIVAYSARKKNVMDDKFLLTPNVDQRLEEVDKIYTARFETDAISVLNKYDVQYILLTGYSRQIYNISDLFYIDDEQCFSLVAQSGDARLYESKCRIYD